MKSAAGSVGMNRFRKKRTWRNTWEGMIPKLLLLCALISILTTLGIVFTLIVETASFFQDVPFVQFITGTEWTALFHGSQQQFGVLPLITGTLLVTMGAAMVAIPIGLASAIYLSEYAPDGLRRVLKPILEILAGIPTVVYGFFAFTFVTPLLRNFLPEMGVFNALSASIVVGIMIIPMIASLSEDAMSSVPRGIREAAYAMGSTKLEVSLKVVVPAALSGIIASFVLGLSRAIGETMIVTLAAGATPKMTFDPTESIQTMTAYMVQAAMGDISFGSTVYKSIYAVGMTLFVFTLVMNLLAQYISRRFKEEY
ncbi:phosphate transport system permease protein [Kroppenstedtia guangzhouensis]|uniref:Phosphate transport system permease protein n=1 Tax=Kroppenstedtia guangzhouensis TaxID=1274356 RepID=A0ABQ1GWJ4_9BACL|nr:phosphate ABC transporter permease subunit PstC [Kroppenstedtia guangzhouensis]GGA51766.1 phosphate transport system permease protein [Kroppenstedtia guangzhouensis]